MFLLPWISNWNIDFTDLLKLKYNRMATKCSQKPIWSFALWNINSRNTGLLCRFMSHKRSDICLRLMSVSALHYSCLELLEMSTEHCLKVLCNWSYKYRHIKAFAKNNLTSKRFSLFAIDNHCYFCKPLYATKANVQNLYFIKCFFVPVVR